MKTKSECKAIVAKFIREKRGMQTQVKFAKSRNVNIKTLHKHEAEGVLDVSVIGKYVDSDNELFDLFQLMKK